MFLPKSNSKKEGIPCRSSKPWPRHAWLVFIGGAVLALGLIWPSMGTAQDKSDKAKDPDPHAQHKDKQPAGDQNLASQIAELASKGCQARSRPAKERGGHVARHERQEASAWA